jgi:hypothetical protein
MSQEATDEHFAQAFSGSVARAQLAVLDPKQEVTRAANAFIETLSGNKVCLVDVPSGAGAASLSFLSTIAQLRAEAVLPRLPLDVHLVAGEIAAPARTYATELLAEMIPRLEAQAIFVTPSLMHWDVLDDLSNTDLIQKMTVHSIEPCRRLLLVANFSGFLERSRNRSKAMPRMDELFRHASGRGALAVWIEPKTNVATNGGGLFAALTKLFPWVRRSHQEPAFMTSESAFFAPFGTTAMVRLAVVRFDLER